MVVLYSASLLLGCWLRDLLSGVFPQGAGQQCVRVLTDDLGSEVKKKHKYVNYLRMYNTVYFIVYHLGKFSKEYFRPFTLRAPFLRTDNGTKNA